MRYLTQDFLAHCELCRARLPTPNARYAHNIYRDLSPQMKTIALILGQNGLVPYWHKSRHDSWHRSRLNPALNEQTAHVPVATAGAAGTV